MGYTFTCDNVVVLNLSNKIWEDFKVIISIACINFLKQTGQLLNVEEDIERFFILQFYNINLLSHAHLYFFSNHIDALTIAGLIGVYYLLHNKTQYSFTECENISSSIRILLPHISTTIALSETIHKVKSLFDSNIHKNGSIHIY